MFSQYPRIFLLGFSLLLLTILVSIFTVYHLSLIARNRTTNESYKLDRVGTRLLSSLILYVTTLSLYAMFLVLKILTVAEECPDSTVAVS